MIGFGVALGITWFAWVPHYRPELKAGESYGVDVSHHQGSIDWPRVAADNISFAYIKATEGGDFKDARFKENWVRAADAGLARGAYHFFTLCTDGDAQALSFLKTVPEDPEALPPAVDLEIAGNCNERPDPVSVRRELQTFLQLVEAQTKQTVLLYVGDDFEDRYAVRGLGSRPLWELRFLRRPGHMGWMVWQVMSLADVNGIEGDVGLDVMR